MAACRFDEAPQSQDRRMWASRGSNQGQRRRWKHVSRWIEVVIQTARVKNSPRCTDVPVRVNRWKEAESRQRTEASWGERDGQEEVWDRGGAGEGGTSLSSQSLKRLMQSSETPAGSGIRRGSHMDEGKRSSTDKKSFQISFALIFGPPTQNI